MRRAKRPSDAGPGSATGEGADTTRASSGAVGSLLPKLRLADTNPHGQTSREDKILGFPLRKASALTAYSAAALTAWASLVRFSAANSQLMILPRTASRYFGRAF